MDGHLPQSGDHNQRLTTLLTDQQRSLYLYIYSLVHRLDDAHDILQDTNLALWRDAERAANVDDFRSWALHVAYNQVLVWRKRQARSRLQFNDALLKDLAGQASAAAEQENVYHVALRVCSQRLPRADHQLLGLRYGSSLSTAAIAKRLERSPAAVGQALYRIRSALLKCIRDRLTASSAKSEEPS